MLSDPIAHGLPPNPEEVREGEAPSPAREARALRSKKESASIF
jgi:hypothetical protein